MSEGTPEDKGTAPRHMRGSVTDEPDTLAPLAQPDGPQRFKKPSSRAVLMGAMLVGLVLWVVYFHSYQAATEIGASLKFLVVGLLAVLAIGALVVAGWRAVDSGRVSERHLFVALFMFCGLLSMVTMAPRTVPDETYHFQCSYKWSDILLGQEVSNSEITARSCDVYLLEPGDNTLNRVSYALATEHLSLFATDTEPVQVKTVSAFPFESNPPQIKIPSALGIALGRLLHLGPVLVYYLGRLFNLIAFAVMAYFAVKWMPVGKRALEVVCLLPMTVQLAASYSYDVVIMGLAFMLTALLLRPLLGGERATNRLMAGAGVLLFLLAPCKVVYSAIALLVFFTPTKRFESRRAAWCWKAGLLVIALIGVVAMRGSTVLRMLGIGATSSGSAPALTRAGESGTRYTISLLWQDPGAFLQLWANTLYDQGDFYLSTVIGGQPGWFQVTLFEPWYLVIPYLFFLLLANVPGSDEPRIPALLRAAFFAIWIAASAGIILSMMVSHTFDTETVIQGVQGRYFLPVLPLALLSFRTKAIQASRSVWPLVLSGTAFLTVASLLRIMAIGLTIVP